MKRIGIAILAVLIAASSASAIQGPFLRKYNAETKINFVLWGTTGVDLKSDAAHASGDTKIMKNEENEANTENGFVDEGQGYSITLTATEMQAARIVIYVVDQGTKAWLDDVIVVETYGHSSAQHAVDLDDGVRAGLTALPNAAADAAGGLVVSDAGGLDIDAVKTTVAKVDTMVELDGAVYKFTANAVEEVSLGDDAMTEEEFNALLLAYWDPSTDPVILTADYDSAKTAAPASTALSNVTWTNTLAGYLDAAISSRSSHSAADVKTAVEAAGSHLALILEDTGTTIPATLTTIANYVDTEVAAILEDTGTTIPATLSAMSAEAVVAELLATEIDGVTVESLWEAQLSDLLGKVTVSGSGGTRTFTYYKQDGTTVKMTITATVPTGARTTTGTLDP